MKKFSVVFLVLSAVLNLAQARQYIQCADRDSWDRAVINLDGENSTLFMTNGVHLPPGDEIRELKRLLFVGKDKSYARFETRSGSVSDQVMIPLEALGVASNSFQVILGHKNLQNGYERERVLGCFSSVFEE